MKHILAVILAAALVFSLAGCTGSSDVGTSGTNDKLNEAKDDLKDSYDSAKDSIDNAGDSAKNAGKGVIDSIDPDRSGSVN